MKNNMKEIEKYVGYYFLAYIGVLMLCGFFQYFTVCQGKSLACNFNITGIKEIITTTATVITPVIAIIGFLSWRNQETYKKSQELIEQILDKIRVLQSNWHESREYDDISRFQDYCTMHIIGTKNFDNLDLFKEEIKKNHKNLSNLSDLMFLVDKLYHEINLDFTELDKSIEHVREVLEQNLEDLYDFHQQLIHIKYGDNYSLKSEKEMRAICLKLDNHCKLFIGEDNDSAIIDHVQEINESISKVSKEIIKLKRKI